MKYLKLLFILNLICFSLFSQKNQDVIYLNNGGIIRGKILENNTSIVKIESYGRNVFVFNQNEIQKVTTEHVKADYPIKEAGYLNFTSIGTVFGSGLNEKPAPFSLLMEHNFRTGKNFAFGAVTGIELLNEAVMPIGGNIKVLFPATNGPTFFIGASGGYSVSLEKPANIDGYYEVTDASGGGMFNSEFGFIFPMEKNISLFLAAGYRYNELHYKRKDWYYQSVDRVMYFNRVSLKIGLTFH
jgi:hypothetical protein